MICKGYTIKQIYPMIWGYIWFDPKTYDGESIDAGNGTVEDCKKQIDEYLESKDDANE